MVPKVSINGESDNKGIIKPSGYFEFDNISNSPCSFIHKVSSEKANRSIACNNEIHQQSLFVPFMHRGTKLEGDKFRLERRKVNSNLETRTCESIRCLHDDLVSSRWSNRDHATRNICI